MTKTECEAKALEMRLEKLRPIGCLSESHLSRSNVALTGSQTEGHPIPFIRARHASARI